MREFVDDLAETFSELRDYAREDFMGFAGDLLGALSILGVLYTMLLLGSVR